MTGMDSDNRRLRCDGIRENLMEGNRRDPIFITPAEFDGSLWQDYAASVVDGLLGNDGEKGVDRQSAPKNPKEQQRRKNHKRMQP